MGTAKSITDHAPPHDGSLRGQSTAREPGTREGDLGVTTTLADLHPAGHSLAWDPLNFAFPICSLGTTTSRPTQSNWNLGTVPASGSQAGSGSRRFPFGVLGLCPQWGFGPSCALEGGGHSSHETGQPCPCCPLCCCVSR